jgi:serine/threonine protein kinase
MVGAFGEVQVMDWGLAKVLGTAPSSAAPPNETVGTQIRSIRESDGTATQAGSVLGTPAFMPPEQVVGAVDQVDSRSDVFGQGAILAVILTGSPPFVSDTAESTSCNGPMRNLFLWGRTWLLWRCGRTRAVRLRPIWAKLWTKRDRRAARGTCSNIGFDVWKPF